MHDSHEETVYPLKVNPPTDLRTRRGADFCQASSGDLAEESWSQSTHRRAGFSLSTVAEPVRPAGGPGRRGLAALLESEPPT